MSEVSVSVKKGGGKAEVKVIEERCKGCGFCIEFCPMHVLDYSPNINARGAHPPYVKNPDACTACGLCEQLCPDLAIYIVKKKEG